MDDGVERGRPGPGHRHVQEPGGPPALGLELPTRLGFNIKVNIYTMLIGQTGGGAET